MENSFNYLTLANKALVTFCGTLDERKKYIFNALVMEHDKSMNDVAMYHGVKRQATHDALKHLKPKALRQLSLGTGLAPKLDELKQAIGEHKLMTVEHAIGIMKGECNDEQVSTLKSLGKLLDFTVTEFEQGETAFVVDDSLLLKDIRKLFGAIKETLQKLTYPTNGDDIVIEVKKTLGRETSKDQTLYILNNYSTIEKTGEQFCLRLPYLNTAGSMAARILRDSRRKMMFQEVIKEMNHALVAAGKSAYNIKETNTSLIRLHPDVCPIGKTGYWVHRDFIKDEDTLPLKERIVHLLQKANSPLPIADIKNSLNSEGLYNSTSIYQALSSDSFARTKEGQVILASWKNMYKDNLKPRSSFYGQKRPNIEDILSIKIRHEIVDLFNAAGVTRLGLAEIRKSLERRGFKTSTVYAVIDKCHYLEKEMAGTQVIVHYVKEAA